MENKFGSSDSFTYLYTIINQLTKIPMNATETYKKGNKELKIFQDENPQSPRDWDNLGTMICFHKKYNLGDKHNYNHTDYNSYSEMEMAIKKKEKACVILPLYIYDHSGITIKTSPFQCRWDSGQIGFIVISKDKVRKEYNVKRITKELIIKVCDYLQNEVSTYDQYLTGDIYGFKLFVDGEETDSCWGFFGSDIKTNGILDHVDCTELINHIKGE